MSRGYVGWWVLLGAVPALAQEPAAEVRSLREMQGRVSAVDARRGTLTLTGTGERVELHVDANTTIFLPGRTGQLTDLSPGQQVRVAYEPREQQALAQWLEVLTP